MLRCDCAVAPSWSRRRTEISLTCRSRSHGLNRSCRRPLAYFAFSPPVRWGSLDFIRDYQSYLLSSSVPFFLQLRAPDHSVHCRILTARSAVGLEQWSGPSRRLWSGPGPPERMPERMQDRMRYRMSKDVPVRMPEKLSEEMLDRMPERM